MKYEKVGSWPTRQMSENFGFCIARMIKDHLMNFHKYLALRLK